MVNRDHDLEWSERLLDWLDDDLPSSERAAFEAHLSGCAECQSQIESLERLDAQLTAAVPTLALGEAFDTRVLAQIHSIDEAQRAAAQVRIKHEFDTSVQLLTQRWRRTWQLLIPSVVGGIALAFAISAWLDVSQLTQWVVDESARWAVSENLNVLGHGIASGVRLGLTGLIGAAVGLGLARWLTRLD